MARPVIPPGLGVGSANVFGTLSSQVKGSAPKSTQGDRAPSAPTTPKAPTFQPPSMYQNAASMGGATAMANALASRSKRGA